MLCLQVWFWRFRSPHNEIVKERSKYQAEAQAVVTKLNKQRAAIMSEAKSQLGLWSDAGIEEARASFWYIHPFFYFPLGPAVSQGSNRGSIQTTSRVNKFCILLAVLA